MYSGKQWMFTLNGLETAKPLAEFVIPAMKFTELTERDGVAVYERPIQVAETQRAVDLEEFRSAYVEALKRYEGAYVPPAEQAVLDRTFAMALQIRKSAAREPV